MDGNSHRDDQYRPAGGQAADSHGQIQEESAIMYRGRAAVKLASRPTGHPWEELELLSA